MLTNLVVIATPFLMFAVIGAAVSQGYSRAPSVAVSRCRQERRQ
jgi:hypothetical protein